MISGYYVLNSKKEVTYREFLKKRFSKVLIPFLVESLIYNLYYQSISSGISMKWIIFGLVKNVMAYPTAAPFTDMMMVGQVNYWKCIPLSNNKIFVNIVNFLSTVNFGG